MFFEEPSSGIFIGSWEDGGQWPGQFMESSPSMACTWAGQVIGEKILPIVCQTARELLLLTVLYITCVLYCLYAFFRTVPFI